MKKLPVHIKIVLFILSLVVIYKVTTSVINPLIGLYNTTTELQLTSKQLDQKQISNYDSYYLAFTDKMSNANINKEAFIEVTNIIMSARKDGQNLAWKWNQENQQIPYGEFTEFYKELSTFISARYEDNKLIETQKQQIVQQHNQLLLTFPNNLYNKALSIQPLVYKAGYISNETKNKFK